MTFSVRCFVMLLVLAVDLTPPLAAQPPLAIGQGDPDRDVPLQPRLRNRLIPKSVSPEFPPAPPLPSGTALPEPELIKLIYLIASNDQSKKREARRRLLKGGPSVIAALIDATDKRPQIYHNIVPPLLNDFIRQRDLESARAAEQALYTLSRSESEEVRVDARAVIANRQTELRKRALQRIQNLGGSIEFAKDFFDVDPAGNLVPVVTHIVIDEHWQGDENSWNLFERIPHLRLIYLADGHPFPEQSVKLLQQAMPDLRIETRGRVRLGIQASLNVENTKGVAIQTVTPGGSAASGGLRAGDIITEFDGRKTDTFPELVKLLTTLSPGDEVEVKYRRKRFEAYHDMQTTITLKAWQEGP